jgi:transcriptional regulator with XRE-family HTH domain
MGRSRGKSTRNHYPELGDALRWLRRQSGLTQQNLTEQTQYQGSPISKIFYSECERGSKWPSPEALGEILKVLGQNEQTFQDLLAARPWMRDKAPSYSFDLSDRASSLESPLSARLAAYESTASLTDTSHTAPPSFIQQRQTLAALSGTPSEGASSTSPLNPIGLSGQKNILSDRQVIQRPLASSHLEDTHRRLLTFSQYFADLSANEQLQLIGQAKGMVQSKNQ